jgi:DNA-binding transcriptional LysR family regulator
LKDWQAPLDNEWVPINELRSISTFAKAVELGSLRKAAAAQGMTPQAVSQAVAQLEQHLGVRLLHRTTRNIALTDEGRQFLEAARPALMGLERAVSTAKRAVDEIAGPLRIIGPRSMFVPVLCPVLDEFLRRYPDVHPDVNLDDRVGNWVEERVDVGFRLGRSAADGVVARKLFTMQLIICASPQYLARYGAPQSLDDLALHRCSGYRVQPSGNIIPWPVKRGDTIVEHEVVPALSTNVEDVEIESALAGHVMSSLTSVAAAQYIRSGRLVPLLTQHVTDHLGLFVYYGSRRAQPARVRAFIDLAIERLQGNADFELSAKELAAAEAKGVKAARAAKRGAATASPRSVG